MPKKKEKLTMKGRLITYLYATHAVLAIYYTIKP